MRKEEEEELYNVVTAEHLATIAFGKSTEIRVGFIDKRNEIWGYKTEIEGKKDNRTSEEIINDTCKKHGIKIIKKEEAQE